MAITFIQGTDCIGDSRLTINNNFSALDIVCQELSSVALAGDITNSIQITDLSSTVQAQQTTITNLTTNVDTLSTDLTTLLNSFNTTNIGPSSTLTTYVSTLSVYDSVGSYIGFIPIYI